MFSSPPFCCSHCPDAAGKAQTSGGEIVSADSAGEIQTLVIPRLTRGSPLPRKTVEIWELQRRLTLFHTSWREPFLPHDGQKSWRWVTADYEKHPWIAASHESACSSDVPPLEPPLEGWEADGEWAVMRPPGDCDEDLWQYAVDFYEADSWWGATPRLNHCRRRLWACSFVQTFGASLPSSGERPAKPVPSPAALGFIWLTDFTTVFTGQAPPFDLSAEAEKLFSDDWSDSLILGLLDWQGATEIEVGPWHESGGRIGASAGAKLCRTREVSMLKKIPPAPMTPKTAQSVVTYRVSREELDGDRLLLRIDANITMKGILYCDYFNVQERTVLKSVDGGVAVAKSFGMVWMKSSMMKGVIESSTRTLQDQSGPELLGFLARRAEPA